MAQGVFSPRLDGVHTLLCFIAINGWRHVNGSKNK